MASRKVVRSSGNGRPKVRVLTKEEAYRLLDRRTRRELHISGEEFLRRFQAGELEYNPTELRLSMLAELAR